MQYTVTLTKAPYFNAKNFFKSWDVQLNGATVGLLFVDLEGKFSVTDTFNQPVGQSVSIKSAYKKAIRYFGRGA